jgi:AraC family transcriptional regulator
MTFNIGDNSATSRRQVGDKVGFARLQLISSALPSMGQNRPRVSGLVSPLPHHVARRLLEHISENIALRLRITELAAAVPLSRSHFSRMFILTFGMTPHRFIMKSRVEVARALLETTNHALSDIAVECGFADQAHFSRVFVKVRGIAPGMWRNNFRSAPALPTEPGIGH